MQNLEKTNADMHALAERFRLIRIEEHQIMDQLAVAMSGLANEFPDLMSKEMVASIEGAVGGWASYVLGERTVPGGRFHEYWSRRLGCEPKKLTYDFGSQSGYLEMMDRECCDMGRCIALFEAIDPHAHVIVTANNGGRDTVYTKRDDKWTAKLPVSE